MRIWTLCCVLFLGGLTFAQVRSVPACAAFAKDGRTAFATINDKDISLKVDRSDGTVVALSLPLRHPVPTSRLAVPASTCSVHFSRRSEIVALGVISSPEPPGAKNVRVSTVDLKTAKWIGDFSVDPRSDFLPDSLAGFLGDADLLVITGTANHKDRAARGEVATMQFSLTGDQLSATPIIRRPVETSDAPRSYPDAEHNRLWLFSCGLTRAKPYHVPLCPIELTSLTGEDQPITFDPTSNSTNREDSWEWPLAFAAPDSNTVVIAETVSGKDTVWRIDMQGKSMERFVLPQRHWVKYNGMHEAALSPDGEVFAVLLNQIKLGFPYIMDNYVFRGTDVVVMQLHPLRLLGIIPHKDSSDATALAVDHRDGKAIVLVYRQGHLERQEFVVPQ